MYALYIYVEYGQWYLIVHYILPEPISLLCMLIVAFNYLCFISLTRHSLAKSIMVQVEMWRIPAAIHWSFEWERKGSNDENTRGYKATFG